MAVATDRLAGDLEPGLERARELAAEANVIPVAHRFVDDCETPVSAFLKLREAFPGRRFCSSRPSRGGSAATRSSAFGRGSSCAGARER